MNGIKRLRINAGLTQTELAELVGVTAAAISGWEHGVANPNVKRLKRVAETLNVTVDELLTEAG